MNNSLRDIAGSYAKYNWISELKVVVFQVGIVHLSSQSKRHPGRFCVLPLATYYTPV